MKYLFSPFVAIILCCCFVSCKSGNKETTGYRLQSLPLSEVSITGGFWEKVYRTSLEKTLPHELSFLESTGRIENFSRAAGLSSGPFQGERYNDSDLYKVIEGIAYHLQHRRNDSLEVLTDSLIGLIAAAQQEDGYLYTPRILHPDTAIPGGGSGRWDDVLISHELYNAGHLYEAAVAYYEATGKRNLLAVALKNADLVIRVFNQDGLRIAPGHQEIELGLVKLARVTGETKYLEQARFFLDMRGGKTERTPEPEGTRFEIYNEPSYMQYHLPVREQNEAVGHAVRAMYLYSGMTDVGALLGDSALLHAVTHIWEDVTAGKIYITGGVGASGRGEAFGAPFNLPNSTAYCETCAAAGNIFWNSRLFNLTGDERYMDLLETVLYNGFLSGIALDGQHFFYPNPLESDGTVHRSEWFGVACCPSNIMRTVPSIPGYIYSKDKEDLYVNLFIESRASTEIHGTRVTAEQFTNYPWDGKILLRISPEKPVRMKLHIRIPGWTGSSFLPGTLYSYTKHTEDPIVVRVNGTALSYDGSPMLLIDRKWKENDRVEIELPMPVRMVQADERVEEDRNKVALTRGPVLYTFEGIDQQADPDLLSLDDDNILQAAFDPSFLTGMTVIEGQGMKAIPYFAWDNRAPTPMKVWIPLKK